MPDESAAPEPRKTHRRGAVYSFGFRFGATWPFGHLAFDDHQLKIYCFGLEAFARRDRGDRIRISQGAQRFSVVDAAGNESDCYFTSFSAQAVRAELVQRGWPVIDDDAGGRYRPEDGPTDLPTEPSN